MEHWREPSLLLEGYIAWVLRWHKHIVVASVVVTMVLGYGAGRLTLTNDTRAYFSEDNPPAGRL